MNSKKAALCILLFFFVQIASADLDCLSSSGTSVGWWSAIKLPESVGTSRHLYYDAADDTAGNNAFKVIKSYVDDEKTALYKTLDQLNSLSRDTTSILAFNDEHPDGYVQFDGAHAKGVVAWDTTTKTGFYIMHSAPKFPIVDDDKVTPTLQKNALKYGQNFFCVTIDESGLEAIQKNLAVSYPSVYYDNGQLGPQTFDDSKSTSETFQARLSGDHFVYLSKSPNATDIFIYEDVMSPYFKTQFMVESWCHPGQEPMCDKKYPSVNIKTITHTDSGISFPEEADHSKWAISYKGRKHVSCSGDMNRADTQAKRGGCSLCFESNSNYYKALSSLVAEHDDCESYDDFLAVVEDLKNLIF